MSEQVHRGGFSLVEVMVALLMLAITMLGIVRVLGAAVDLTGAAENHRRALDAVGALAQTAAPGIDHPIGRRPVSLPGPDGIPGTADDPPPSVPGCQRQVDALASFSPQWLWVRAWCGVAARSDGPESLASARLLVAR